MNTQKQSGPLSTLAYRSRAVPSFSTSELDSLIETARARNRAAAITGMLIYDEGRFFQWLEGPSDQLSNLWQTIRKDPRHTGIEVLDDTRSEARMFGQWDLKFAAGSTPLQVDPTLPVVVSRDLLGSLYRNAQAPAALLSNMGVARAAIVSTPPGANVAQGAVLRQMVDAEVIPELVKRHRADRPRLPLAHPRAAELAKLLTAADPADAFALLDLLQVEAGSLALSSATVYEPAARTLGELWADDACTDVDVTLGLGRLQGSLRQLELAMPVRAHSGRPLRAVLVAPQPGEVHMLGAVLDAEVLWRDGWDIQCEFPATDAALNTLVAEHWFEAIDLSLSAAFRREHWLPRVAKTIAAARRASVNPEIVVVVGGRIFYEQGANATLVGADAESATALNLTQTLTSSLRRHDS